MNLRTLQTQDGTFELTDEQVQNIWSRKLTLGQIQKRLDDGWGLIESIELNKNYYMYEGDICLRFADATRVLYIPIYVIERIGIHYNDTQRLFNNLSEGKSLRNAVSNMQGGIFDRKLSNELEAVDDTELVKDRQVERMRSKARAIERKRLARAERAKQRDMERRPHMYDGTPQKHTRGAYTEYLMQNDIFPKVVK
ncbi:SA1788 family PVL leukocidin-associated protein [Staphylococcus equorum]